MSTHNHKTYGFLQPWVIDYLSKHPDYLGQMPAANTEMFEIGC